MTVGRKKQWCISLLFILIVFFSGCIFSPGKKEKEDIPPQINSLDLSDGAIVTTRDLIITWQGNKAAELYQYTLNDVTYDWTESTYVELTDLDETEHIFTLQARKDSVFSSLYTRSFTVDAIQGPGIVFSPRKISSISNVAVKLEDVSGLMAAHIEIICDDNCANIMDFISNDENIENGSIISFSDKSDKTRLIIDIGIPGLPQGFYGSLDIGSFLVNPLKNSGEITVDPEKTEFRDINNNTILINGYDMVRIIK